MIMKRSKPKHPRRASTYRAARRNVALRGEVRTVWKGIEAKYRPVTLDRPPIQIAPGAFRERRSPKRYATMGGFTNGRRECERRMRQMAASAVA